MKITTCFGILLSVAVAASAQTADPTRTSDAMADTLRTQIAEFRALSIRALVVGADDDGVALLDAAGKSSDPVMVRSGTVVSLEFGGMPVRLTVKSVSSSGVEIDAPTLSDKLMIPGGFRPAPAADSAAPELRYLECSEVRLDRILRLIADQTGANISASASASASGVSVFLRNVSAEDAVEEICRSLGLWFRFDDKTGITRVTTMREYEDSLSSFREEQTESFTLLYPNVVEMASVIYGLYPDRVYLTMGEEDILDDELNDLSRRFERFRVIDDSSSSSLLSINPGSVSSSSGSGSAFNSEDFNTRGLNIDSQTRGKVSGMDAETASAIETAKASGDAASLEKLLKGYSEKSPSIFVTVSRRNNIIIVRTSDPEVMNEIRELVRRLDVATPSVLLEVRVMQLTLSDGFNSTFEYEFLHDTTAGGNEYKTTGGFPGFAPLANSARTDSMSFQLLSEHFNARIQMLEKEGKANTLATPTLLIANNEVSRIFIGEEIPVTTGVTLEPQTGTTSGGVTVTTGYTVEPQIEMVAVGTTLLITPNINADRSVTLRLLQEDSDRVPNGGSIPYGDASTLQTYPVDTVSSRRISGTFITQDGLIAAIGGLIKEEESEQISRVPFLGRLPLIGFLFRSTEKVKSRSELVIFVRPHVITTPAEGEGVSRRLLENLTKNPRIHETEDFTASGAESDDVEE